MKKRKVIAWKNRRTPSPVILTLVLMLTMDHWEFSGVWRGVIYACLALFWIGFIVDWLQAEEVDIFADRENQRL